MEVVYTFINLGIRYGSKPTGFFVDQLSKELTKVEKEKEESYLKPVFTFQNIRSVNVSYFDLYI